MIQLDCDAFFREKMERWGNGGKKEMKGVMAGERADPVPLVGSRLGFTYSYLNRRQGPVNWQPPRDLGETGELGCLP